MTRPYKRHTIKSDGLELVVEESGKGQPIIFAHGLTGSRVQSHRQMDALADRYRVIVFDQRGHAESSPVYDERLFDIQRMAEDVTAILDALGIDKAIVGGESMGAGTSLRFALSHPERVSALVLCLPALSDEPLAARGDVKDFSPAITAKGIKAFAEENMLVEIANGASPQRARAWADIIASHDTQSIALACRIVPDWIVFHDKADLRRLTMPVQIIAIDGDPVHPLALARRLHAEIPHSQLLVVDPPSRYAEEPEMIGRTCGEFLGCQKL